MKVTVDTNDYKIVKKDRHPNGHTHDCNVWVGCQQCDGPDLTRACDCGKV